jgi:phosphatidylserine decarboxylase
VDQNPQKPEHLHPVVQEFKTLIENNTRIYMLVSAMFQEVPNKHPYNKDMSGQVAQIRDYEVRVLLLSDKP